MNNPTPEEQEKIKKKNKREAIISLIMLFVIGIACAAYVINFRYKMLPYEIENRRAKEAKEAKEEAEYAKQNPNGKENMENQKSGNKTTP